MPSAEQETVWEGTWMNRKYNTRGPLRCTAAKQNGVRVKATFSGLFRGEGFQYNVDFDAKRTGQRTVLQGSATLDGDRYQWTGCVQGDTMLGQFKSLKGNNETFRLRKNGTPRE